MAHINGPIGELEQYIGESVLSRTLIPHCAGFGGDILLSKSNVHPFRL